MQVHEASQDKWDHFESGYSARYARWLAAHATDHADSGEVRQRAAPQWSAYRGTLGFAYRALSAV